MAGAGLQGDYSYLDTGKEQITHSICFYFGFHDVEDSLSLGCGNS